MSECSFILLIYTNHALFANKFDDLSKIIFCLKIDFLMRAFSFLFDEPQHFGSD